MVYPLLTLDDETVKVYMETADEVLGFKHATCWLPSNNWEDIYGYSENDIKRLKEVIRSTAHLIIQFPKEGRRFCKYLKFLESERRSYQ